MPDAPPLTVDPPSSLALVEPSSSERASEEALFDRKDHRSPPHNYEAEQALLGALLHNNTCFELVGDFLHADHFADQTHGRIYSAIHRLIDRGQIADPITLKAYFSQDEALEAVGGEDYLIQLADSVVSIINVKDYAQTIYDLFLRRELIDLGENVVNNAHVFDLDSSATQQIEETEQRLFDLATTDAPSKGFQPFSQALNTAITMADSAFRRPNKVVGVTSGLTDLDQLLGGLHPSDLIIVAGRPSMGKTGLATNIALSAALAHLKDSEQGGAVAFFSLEMSSEQLAARILAQQTRIPSDKIRRGDINQKDFDKFAGASRDLCDLPFHIDDTPAISVSAMRTRARRLKRQKGLGLIVVDYLQLMQPSIRSRGGSENRVNEISEITRGLKAVAKELQVPVIALSQLSRAVEQRDDKRPQLSDLRESGTIEQDSDVVLFIYREEYYLARKEPQRDTDKHKEWQKELDKVHNIADLIIAKQRHGPVKTLQVQFDGRFTEFRDLVDESRLPAQ